MTNRVTTTDQLRQLYRQPSTLVQNKKSSTIGPETAARLATSPFVLLATADSTGACDVSPRGGPPGLVAVIDEHTVALPDLGGNNLVDSLTNIVDNPHAGLLVLTPGDDETVRIDGIAELRTDPEILDLWDGLFRRPKLAVVIGVSSVFIHCAKAFRRSQLWNVDSWTDDAPDASALLDEHLGGGLDRGAVRAGLDDSYRADLAEEQP
jgi:PPOX class probable FMN-dependent enzyme